MVKTIRFVIGTLNALIGGAMLATAMFADPTQPRPTHSAQDEIQMALALALIAIVVLSAGAFLIADSAKETD